MGAAVRLNGTRLGAGGRSIVAQWTGGMALATAGLFALGVADDVASGETLVVKLLSGLAFGGVVGFVTGQRTARAQVHATRAVARRREFDFLNKLLRHHVLNPVNIIRGYAGEVRACQDCVTEADTIEAQSDRIANVVSDVRVVSEALSGEVTYERVDLAAILQGLLAEFETTEDVSIDTALPVEARVWSVGGLSVVFRHLVENAIDHADGDVTGRCR